MEPSLRSMRPWYLVMALMATWFAGFRGLMASCGTLLYLRGESAELPAEGSVAESSDAWMRLATTLENARLSALAESPALGGAVTAGGLVLSALLIFASGIAMSGRRGGRALAMQALAANGAFAIVEFAVTRPVRAAMAEAWMRSASTATGDMPGAAELWWAWRISLAIQLGVFAAAAWAMTRPRANAFYAAVARHAERRE